MTRQGSTSSMPPGRVPASRLCYGIPDIALERLSGGTVNPSWFAGHELLIFFCPADPVAAAAEIASYVERSEEFAKCGAWLIGVRSDQASRHEPVPDPITIALDPSGDAWAAFESLLDPAARTAEAAGGTFLFYRGGCLGRAWQGPGHASEALEALRRRG